MVHDDSKSICIVTHFYGLLPFWPSAEVRVYIIYDNIIVA